jgi:hypothetical protein
VSAITDGSGHADMIQDLNDIAVLGRENPDPLTAIGFDLTPCLTWLLPMPMNCPNFRPQPTATKLGKVYQLIFASNFALA